MSNVTEETLFLGNKNPKAKAYVNLKFLALVLNKSIMSWNTAKVWNNASL